MTIIEIIAALEAGNADRNVQKMAADVLECLWRERRLPPGYKMRCAGQRRGEYRIPRPPYEGCCIVDIGESALARGDAAPNAQRNAAWFILASIACFGLDLPRQRGGGLKTRKRPNVPAATKFYRAVMLVNSIDSAAEFWHSYGSGSPITQALQNKAQSTGQKIVSLRQRYKEALALLRPSNALFAAEVRRLLAMAGELKSIPAMLEGRIESDAIREALREAARLRLPRGQCDLPAAENGPVTRVPLIQRPFFVLLQAFRRGSKCDFSVP